ncbi:MAG: hypothetical protein V4598_08375 [Bdellovibrionota bacterium]
MRFTLLLMLFAFPALAQETVSFQNDREGQSFYYNAGKINRALRDFKAEEIVEIYQNSIKGVEASKVCAYDINKSMSDAFIKKSPRFDSYEGALIFLRHWNHLDDVSLKILLDARKVSTLSIDAKDPQQLRKPDAKKIADMLKVVASFKEKFLKNGCYDEAYRNMVGEIRKVGDASEAELEGLYVEASKKKMITADVYNMLERARAGEVTANFLTLKTYSQKMKSLRLHKPLRDATERSDFVTQKVNKMKVSHRVKLMEQYSDLQIMMMADVVKRLRTRLEAKKVTITIFGEEEDVEVITLEPMERFRLAIKLLRKEMKLLSLNTYFNGRTPDYMDLITASYETSLIPAVELKELGGLQEIWNPTKTFWEKASVWIRTFSSVATIAIPAPYGFIPALVLVVIEATVGKGADTQPDDTVLF